MSFYSEATKNARIPVLQETLIQVLLEREKDPQLRECIELWQKVKQSRASADMDALQLLLARLR